MYAMVEPSPGCAGAPNCSQSGRPAGAVTASRPLSPTCPVHGERVSPERPRPGGLTSPPQSRPVPATGAAGTHAGPDVARTAGRPVTSDVAGPVAGPMVGRW